MIYRHFFRPLLFLLEAERAHDLGMKTLQGIDSFPSLRKAVRSLHACEDERLKKKLFGLEFPNPLGVAAGLDKNAIGYPGLGAFGVGFVEIGTITPRPQKGNPGPRLFRLPRDRALLNRMGFNNDGAERIAERLRERKGERPLLGGNIGKNKETPNEEAAADHEGTMRPLDPFVDYWVINISSPNTPGLRELQGKEYLKRLLGETLVSRDRLDGGKPLLVKLSPDMEQGEVDEMLEVFQEERPDGLIATNTTVGREGLRTSKERLEAYGNGGISGAPLKDRSDRLIRYLKEGTGEELPIIGVGGIMNEDDALAKLDAGADLIQVYTGLIYEGPALMKRILRAILDRELANEKQKSS
jgi:dihydroorotate dehydrogenase